MNIPCFSESAVILCYPGFDTGAISSVLYATTPKAMPGLATSHSMMSTASHAP